MKRIIRHYAVDTFCLWATSQVAKGLVFEKGIYTLLFAGLALTAVSIFAKPVINLLLLPLNLVTFGFFRWVASAVMIYLVTLIIKDFKVTNFIFSGFSNRWLEIPPLHFEGFLAFIGFSFLISILMSFIYWLIK